MLPWSGVAQDFSISVIDLNGKSLPDTLRVVPSWVKVKVTSDDHGSVVGVPVPGQQRFRFRKVEAILARKNARVATINSTSPNLDLQVLTSQTNPGDHLVFMVNVEEAEGEKSLREYTKTISYVLSGK
jgi:hypothetical protein